MVKLLLTITILASIFVNCLAITCYYRSYSSSSSSNGSTTTCSSSTMCYSYISNSIQYASCTSSGCSIASCTTCNTDYCNTLTPSAISCYTRSSINATNNGTMTMCPTGISTCYTEFSSGEAGCGVCTSTYTALYGCSTCNTSYCNTQTPSSISCYNRPQNPTSVHSTDGYISTCPTAVSTCYTHNLDGEAACGTCTSASTSRYSCTSCNSNNCNTRASLTFGCFQRTSSTSSYSNGSTSTCGTGVSTCYTHYSNGEAGCGTCSTYDVTTYGCRSCSGRFCNYRPEPLKCYNTDGFSYMYRNKEKVTCRTSTSCFVIKYVDNDYYAGCGSCTSSSIYSTCRVCYTDYCNSATLASIRVDMAVVGVALLALMKIF